MQTIKLKNTTNYKYNNYVVLRKITVRLPISCKSVSPYLPPPQAGMLLTFGLPTLCPPYERHVRPHVIPILLPLSQVIN